MTDQLPPAGGPDFSSQPPANGPAFPPLNQPSFSPAASPAPVVTPFQSAPLTPPAVPTAANPATSFVPVPLDPATFHDPIMEPQIAPAPEAATQTARGDIPALQMYLGACLLLNGSDLHLQGGTPPRVRVHGELKDLDGYPELNDRLIRDILEEALPADAMERFYETLDADLAYEMFREQGAIDDSRFRVNLAMAETGPYAVFRVIPPKVIPYDVLGLRPQIRTQVLKANRGLFLVTGVTGSGKSTTLASLADELLATRYLRMLTLEDPIEYRHRSQKGTVTQREIGRDTKNFHSALRAALRQDPDVILIGELRDAETIQIAMEAADTGHLVFGTLHTSSARETVNRIVGMFPGDERDRVQTVLASVLAGVVCQTLVPSPTKGRVAATEIMVMTDAIRNSIRTGKIEAIDQLMTDQSTGSIRLDNHLAELVKNGDITLKQALLKAQRREEVQKLTGTATI